MNFRLVVVLTSILLASLLAAVLFGASTVVADRMPPIPPEKMTAAQKKAAELLDATPRGTSGPRGPFVPLLRSPEFMNRLQNVGAYLRFNNTIPQKLVEMTILMTARQWTQQYEWAMHYPLALKAGVNQDIVNAIAEGRRPMRMAEDEELVWDFNTEIAQTKTVSDATYARAVKKFGEPGVVDLTGVTGYYSTLAMIMAVAKTPPPAPSAESHAVPALVPFTH
jgi:4-carboxymuconolactone decarboxylase